MTPRPPNRRRPARAHWLVSSALIAGLATAATAKPRAVTLGDLTFTLETTRWQPETLGADAIALQPAGDAIEKVDTIEVRRISSDVRISCSGLARDVLHADLYADMRSASIVVGNRPATRFEALTRCRNATPAGVVVCVANGGALYLIHSRISDCRSAPPLLHSTSDPIAEILQGAVFAR